MLKRNEEKGITLIALVVTIIVLLILAAVSIAMLTGENGILTNAKDAREKTREANTKEIVQVEVQGSYGTDGNIDVDLLNTNLKRIKNLKYKGELLSDSNKVTKDDFPVEMELDGFKLKIESNGNVLLISNGNPNDSGNDDNASQEFVGKDLAEVSKSGNYVRYIVPTGEEITIPSGIITSYVQAQTFSSNLYSGEDQLWQILYNDENTGIVELVSSGNVLGSEMVQIGSSDESKMKTCWLNYVSKLNEICGIFVNNEFADRGRCLGSDPDDPSYEIKDAYSMSSQYGNYRAYTGFRKGIDNSAKDIQALDRMREDENPIGTDDFDCWLGSRWIDPGEEEIVFRYGRMMKDGSIANGWFFSSYKGTSFTKPSSKRYGIRACVRLLKGVKICGGTGSKENPFELYVETNLN